MPKIHNIKSSEILKFMLKNWFEIHNQKWSHIQLKKWNKKITIPNHSNKILNIKTILSIFKQSGIDKDDYLNPKK